MGIKKSNTLSIVSVLTYLFQNLIKNFFIKHNRHIAFAIFVFSAFVTVCLCYVLYAYAEKYVLVDSYFFGKLQWSFVDRSYPEFFGYILEFFCVIVFAVYAYKTDQKAWYAWAFIFLFILLDDSFQLHERFGAYLQERAGLSISYRDPLAFGSFGVFIILGWFCGLWQILKTRESLGTYIVFSIYLGALIFFGVFVDAIHGYLHRHGDVSQTVMTLIEDGSELFVLCIAAITAHGFWTRKISIH